MSRVLTTGEDQATRGGVGSSPPRNTYELAEANRAVNRSEGQRCWRPFGGDC